MTSPHDADQPEQSGRVTLEVHSMEVSYGEVRALRELSFRLVGGQSLAVVGAAGAGKSSLLWALAGATPYVGSARLSGALVSERADAAARGIALVPQGNGLATALSAEENIVVPLVVAGVPIAEATSRAREALETVGLDESGRHLVEELSGGQQQRVAVARALALRPAVLLADEPTSDLDSANRERVVTALLAAAAQGAVVVVATHDPETADAFDGELALDEGVGTWSRPLPRRRG